MKLQPNLKYRNEDIIVEQPYQMSVNRIFEVLSSRDVASFSEYSKTMDSISLLDNIKNNIKNTPYSLNREIIIKKENYSMYINGAALCVDKDLKIFWHLLDRKLQTDEFKISDFCKEMGISNPYLAQNHKSIIESFFRLSSNNVKLATKGDDVSIKGVEYSFNMIDYRRENDTIKYSFNKDFLKLVNSKNGLQRHSLTILNNFKVSASKMLYTMLSSNKYNQEGIRKFNIDDLMEQLGMKDKRKDKAKDYLKKALKELKDKFIIGDFNMKLNDVTIYNNHYVTKKEQEAIKAKIKEDKKVEEEVKKDSFNKSVKKNTTVKKKVIKNPLALDKNGQYINPIDMNDEY